EAVSLLRQTISWNLDDGKIHHNLGSALFYLGRYAEAAAHYEKATSLGPAKADLYDSLGVALLRLHRYIEAENAFRKAMQIDPQYEAAKKHLGDIKGIEGGR
ncbi:MAG: tetratricopeptide repeat protein, partial [Syntrophales bacterium]|nr:tetratricopeptide repeat protein [Syntrophales bacterium]